MTFLSPVGARFPGGAPPKGASEIIVVELYKQGRTLIEAARSALPAVASERTVGLFAGVPTLAPALWCTRLSLPFFSIQKLEALFACAASRRRRGQPLLSPRRLAVWCIARRLAVDAPVIVEKVPGMASDIEYFQGSPNPIVVPS